jgi:hypothetical protein
MDLKIMSIPFFVWIGLEFKIILCVFALIGRKKNHTISGKSSLF